MSDRKPRTVILGEKPQGSQWLRMVLGSGFFDVVAGVPCLTRKRWWGEDTFADVLREHTVPVLKRAELQNIDYDILLSFLYPFIIEGELLGRASMYAVNLHEAPLPKFRGCNGCSHAILERDTHYGTSLHTMEAELDAGELVDQGIFSIDEDETSKELYARTIEFSTKLLERNLAPLASGTIATTPLQTVGEPINPRSSLADMKKLTAEQVGHPDTLYRIARALDFPPFEPPSFATHGRTFYVFVDRSLGRGSHSDGAQKLPSFDREAFGRGDVFLLSGFARHVVIMSEDEYRRHYPIFS